MECHGCRTRGERAAQWQRRSRSSDGGQRHPDTIAFIVATRRGDSDSHSATESGTHTDCDCDCDWGLASTQCTALVRSSFVRRIRSCARSLVCSLPSCRSFVYLTRSHAFGLPTRSPSPSDACVCDCDSTSGPLGVPHSLTADTLWLAFGSAYVCSFVRSAALSRCPPPAACVSALFGVFHQHISCLSLSDENYVDDVGAALPLLTLTLSLSVASSVCLSLCALCTSPPQHSRCQPPLLMSTSATTSESCAKLEHQHFVCALLLFIFMFALRPLPIPPFSIPPPFSAYANS